MKYSSLLFVFLSLILAGCSDNSDEVASESDKLIGYWAITHIKTIEQIGDGHNNYDEDVPPHGLDSYVNESNPRWDVLIFDEDFVTVRGDMPNRPKGKDYNLDTPEGQLEYNNALDNWNESIRNYSDADGCPVGPYSISGNDLIIGSLNMGILKFTSNKEFTLDYRKPLNASGDYKRLIYTYSRIYSLTL